MTRDLHHSMGIDTAAIIASTPLGAECETCDAAIAAPCIATAASERIFTRYGYFHPSRVEAVKVAATDANIEALIGEETPVEIPQPRDPFELANAAYHAGRDVEISEELQRALKDDQAQRRGMKPLEHPAPCALPPPGWYCTRGALHVGPCAALPIDPALSGKLEADLGGDPPAVGTFDMSDVERQRALDAAVEANKEQARAAGHVGAPSPAMVHKIRRCRQLRDDLAGYAALPEVAKASTVVQDSVGPKMAEYIALRHEIAREIVNNELARELGVPVDLVTALVDARDLAGNLRRAADRIDPPAPTAKS